MLHASLKTSFLYYLLSGLNANEANKCFNLRTYEIFQLTFLDFAFKLNQLFIWFSMHFEKQHQFNLGQLVALKVHDIISEHFIIMNHFNFFQ